MSKKLIKIGIDIDNVLTDSYPYYLEKFNSRFKTEIKFDELTDFFFFENNSGIALEEIQEFFESVQSDYNFQFSLPVFPDAVTSITGWARQGAKIHYITARRHYSRQVTQDWLRKHGLWVKDASLDVFPEGYPDADPVYKREAADRIGIDLMIEDSLEIADVMSIPVFLFDKPWNRGKLKSNVRRIYSWNEIDAFVSGLLSKRERDTE